MAVCYSQGNWDNLPYHRGDGDKFADISVRLLRCRDLYDRR